MPSVELKDCPCSGKSMSHYTAPWILLTLYHRKGTHGYEIKKILKKSIEDLGLSINITGIYRHLKALEQRGMLSSRWDTNNSGLAKRRYYLTEKGQQCLWNWMQTLSIQFRLIAKFFDEAQGVFPVAAVPQIQLIKKQQI